MFYTMIASYQISEISVRYHDYVNYIKSLSNFVLPAKTDVDIMFCLQL